MTKRTIGERVIINRAGRHLGFVGVVDMIRGERVGVLVGRSRLWFLASELGSVA